MDAAFTFRDEDHGGDDDGHAAEAFEKKIKMDFEALKRLVLNRLIENNTFKKEEDVRIEEIDDNLTSPAPRKLALFKRPNDAVNRVIVVHLVQPCVYWSHAGGHAYYGRIETTHLSRRFNHTNAEAVIEEVLADLKWKESDAYRAQKARLLLARAALADQAIDGPEVDALITAARTRARAIMAHDFPDVLHLNDDDDELLLLLRSALSRKIADSRAWRIIV